MKRLSIWCCSALLSFSAQAATLTGRVVDPARAGVGGARLTVTGRLGVVQQTTADGGGNFRLESVRLRADSELVVTAPGFARKSIALDAAGVEGPIEAQLEIAPVNDSITVSG